MVVVSAEEERSDDVVKRELDDEDVEERGDEAPGGEGDGLDDVREALVDSLEDMGQREGGQEGN